MSAVVSAVESGANVGKNGNKKYYYAIVERI